MKLLDRLVGGAVAKPPPPAPSLTAVARLAGERDAYFGKPPIGWSQDLARVLDLPRRDLASTYGEADFSHLEARLRRPTPECVCARFGKRCPTFLLPVQRLALLEAAKVGGGVFPIGVGHGKTLIDLLLPMVMGSKVAVLLIPANLRAQLLEVDWHYYGGHWTLPNLAGGRWFKPGPPPLHVLSYNELSSQNATDLLSRIKPDLIICDEAHNLKSPDSSRTVRFLRYVSNPPVPTRLCVLSGTLATRSIKDYAHLAQFALGQGSPLPLNKHVVEEWSTALDPGNVVAPPGELQKLGPGDVRDAYRRWRNATPGVVATDESAVGNSLVIRKRDPGPMPAELAGHIQNAHNGMRPDGEEFVEELQRVTCARQLSAGFFHRWRYPDIGGVPQDPKVIERWFARRQEFNRELREKLKRPREHLDSPGLLVKAAIRAYQQPPYDGEKPVWKAETWPEWSAIHRDVVHVTEAVWLSDWLIQDAAAWARKNVGIVWVEFPELGEKIARAASALGGTAVPFYGGGPDASDQIIRESGKRSVVASIKAHGTGKNLTMFSRNLVVNPMADGAAWEQLIGRTHRQGQLADEVEVEVYQHSEDYRTAFRKAREFARFIQATEGTPQKLLFANYEWVAD